MKKEYCESKQQWSGEAIISGHSFVEIPQEDKKKQILKCKICGEISEGFYR